MWFLCRYPPLCGMMASDDRGEDMTPCELVRYFYETVVSQNLSRRLPEFIADNLLVRTGESGLIMPQG